MSCSFFKVLKVANINSRQIIYRKSSQILGYAVDLYMIRRRTKADFDVGKKVNKDKTKYLLFRGERSKAASKCKHWFEVSHDNDVNAG